MSDEVWYLTGAFVGIVCLGESWKSRLFGGLLMVYAMARFVVI